MKTDFDIDALAQSIYNDNVQRGWWADNDRCVYTTLQLVSTEIAEATEGYRKTLLDDHLPEIAMEEVELADTLIRVLDIAGRCDLMYDSMAQGRFKYGTDNLPQMHLSINYYLIAFAGVFKNFNGKYMNTVSHERAYSKLVDCILNTAKLRSYNLYDTVLDKLEYNRQRADHNYENRMNDLHGKKI